MAHIPFVTARVLLRYLARGDLRIGRVRWGHVLASVVLPAGAPAERVTARVARGWPELVPPSADRARCVQRTWWVSGQGATVAALTLGYLDAGLRSREGFTIKSGSRRTLASRERAPR